MTYDEREQSQHGGQPVECYRFSQGAQLWLYTSADREITLPAGIFQPQVVTRGEQDFTPEEIGGNVEIRLRRTDPVVESFIPYVPTLDLNVSIYRAHRGEESLAIAWFIGSVATVRYAGSEGVLRCVPISNRFKRRCPALAWQGPCNWAVYSAACGVNPELFRDEITVTTIEGFDVVSNDFTSHADGWYSAGWLERADGDRRFIVNHVGNRVTLMTPFLDLQSLEVVDAYAGCDRLETTCETKFSNRPKHLGWGRMPLRNPHEERIA